MSARTRGLAVGVALLAPLAACVDLFHSTNFENACDVDAALCETSLPEASVVPSDGGPTDFCAWSSSQAHDSAARACAWLGACASPVGDNAFGPCMVHALLAYDCTIAPDRRLRPGPEHDLWDALWQATSCAEVLGAVLPPHTIASCAPSSTAYSACTSGGATLVSCAADDAGTGNAAGLEVCSAWGQTCAAANGLAACAGSTSLCAGEDAGTTCVNDELQDCEPDAGPFDQGVNCTAVGAGKCVAGSPAACLSTGDAGCTQSPAVTCDGGVAIGCPSGAYEQVDCDKLLGSPSCTTAAAGPSWDVSRACTADMGAGASCTPDSCTGTNLSSCARGAFFSVDCASQSVGFSACAVGADGRATCVP